MPKRVALALALLLLIAAGCGSEARLSEDGASAANGKALFTGEGQCGGCHTLADAGTQSSVGPNLDDAFRQLRAQGFDESTIRDVVHGQILYPTENPAGIDEEGRGLPGMPAGLVTGQDAKDVAAYVASVAGTKPAGEAAPATDGKDVFTQSCGSCHTLEAAGTSGTIGPNLDQAKTPLQDVIRQVRNGGGGMPAFEGQLTDEQIEAVSKFVADNAGK